MANVFDPERLIAMRKLRGLSQEALAKKARHPLSSKTTLNKQTVYQLEKAKRPPRKGTVERLAKALDVDPGVLTGEKPIPAGIAQPRAGGDEDSIQLYVRVHPAVRNAFELVARRYGISVPKIAHLAPLLFTIAAEASLDQRRKNVDECRARYGDYCEAKSLIPYHIPVYELDDEIGAEEESIANNDIFGRSLPDDRDNPFAAYLESQRAGTDDITVGAVEPSSADYRVCRPEAVALAGEELADSLLNGEVLLHQIPRGLMLEQRIEWIRDHRTSVREIHEEIEEEIPDRIILPSEAIDIEF